MGFPVGGESVLVEALTGTSLMLLFQWEPKIFFDSRKGLELAATSMVGQFSLTMSLTGGF